MTLALGIAISIHALREESDEDRHRAQLLLRISIHALREESDPSGLVQPAQRRYFNPRSP